MDIYLLPVLFVALAVAQAVVPSNINGDSMAIGNPRIKLKSTLTDKGGNGPRYAFWESPSPTKTRETTTPYPSSMTADQIRDAKLFPDHRVSRIDVSSLVDVPATRPGQRNRPDSSPIPDPSPYSPPYPRAYSGVRTKLSEQSEPSLNRVFRFNGNRQMESFEEAPKPNYRFNSHKDTPPLFSAFDAFLARMGNVPPQNQRREDTFNFNQIPKNPPQQPTFTSNYNDYPHRNGLVASSVHVKHPSKSYSYSFAQSSGGNTFQTAVNVVPLTSGTLNHVARQTTLSMTPMSRYPTGRPVFNTYVTQSHIFKPRISCDPCTNFCFFGYETNGAGCSTCVCKKPVFSMCPVNHCPIFCPSGYQRNSVGCDTCTCKLHSVDGGMFKYWGDNFYNNRGFE